MRKAISADHFKNFIYPCRLQILEGRTISYGIRTVDMEQDRYPYSRRLIRDGADLPMAPCFSEADSVRREKDGSFLLVFSGEAGSSLRLLDREDGEPREIFSTERTISQAFSLGNGRYQLLCSDNLHREGRTARELEDQTRYETFDEYPFWFNGSGIIDGTRSRLYVWEQGRMSRVTPEFMNVSMVTPLEDSVVFCGVEFTDLREQPGRLWSLSRDTLELRAIHGTENFYYSMMAPADREHVYCLRTDRDRYGEGQNAYIDLLNVTTGALESRLNEDCALAARDSLYSDAVYGAGISAFVPCADGVIFIATVRDTAPLFYADFAAHRITPLLEGEFAVWEAALSEDQSTLYFLAQLEDSGCELWARNMSDGSVTQLTHYNDALREEYIQLPVERFTFPGSGNTPIDGYVIRPLGYTEGKTYKTIVTIHGGPACTFGRFYYMELQYLATLGYAVLFCNPHGSVGYGQEFQDLREKYYTCDLEDILCMLRYAHENLPFLDLTQAAVTGGSYGGMMVNWIITHYDFFKTAISDRGCANELEDFFMSDCGVGFSQDVRGGLIWDEGVFEKVWAASPIRYADRVTTPTLFIHSEFDFRCTKEQSLSMYAALKLHGVKTRVHLFRGENHGMAFSGKPRNRALRLELMRKWLAETL